MPAPSNNYFALLPSTKDTNSFDVKMDYNCHRQRPPERTFQLRAARWSSRRRSFGLAGGDGPAAHSWARACRRRTASGVNYDRIFSPTLITEFRVGVAHYHNDARNYRLRHHRLHRPRHPGREYRPVHQRHRRASISTAAFPIRWWDIRPACPGYRAEANIDMVNSWTKTKGNHTFKWGVDLRRVRDDLLQDQTYSPRGMYNFGNQQTALCTPSASTPRPGTVATPPVGDWQRHGQLPAGPAVPAPAAISTLTSRRTAQLGIFRLWRRQVAGFSQADAGSGSALGVLPAGHAAVPGRLLQLQPEHQQTGRGGRRRQPLESGHEDALQILRAAHRAGLPPDGQDRDPRRLRHQLHAIPGQHLRLQLSRCASNNFYNNVGDGYAPALLPNGQPATFQQGFPLPVPVAIPSNGIIPARVRC